MSGSTATIELKSAFRRLAAARMWASNSAKTRMTAETALVAAKSTFEAAKADERDAAVEVADAERCLREAEARWGGGRKKRRVGDLEEEAMIAAAAAAATTTNETNAAPNDSTNNFHFDSRARDLDENMMIAATTPREHAATKESNGTPNLPSNLAPTGIKHPYPFPQPRTGKTNNTPNENVSTNNFNSTPASTGIKYPTSQSQTKASTGIIYPQVDSKPIKKRRSNVDGGKSLVSFLIALSAEKLINQQHISQSAIPEGWCIQNNRSYIRYALELVEFVVASSDELSVDFINLASDFNSPQAVAAAAERIGNATSAKLEELDSKKRCLTVMGIGGRVRRYKKRIAEALGKISPETEFTMKSVEIIGLEELVELEGAAAKRVEDKSRDAEKASLKDVEVEHAAEKNEPKEDVHSGDAEAGEKSPFKDTEIEDETEKSEPKEDVHSGDKEAAEKSPSKDAEMEEDGAEKSDPNEDVDGGGAEAADKSPSKDAEMEDGTEKSEPKEDVHSDDDQQASSKDAEMEDITEKSEPKEHVRIETEDSSEEFEPKEDVQSPATEPEPDEDAQASSKDEDASLKGNNDSESGEPSPSADPELESSKLGEDAQEAPSKDEIAVQVELENGEASGQQSAEMEDVEI